MKKSLVSRLFTSKAEKALTERLPDQKALQLVGKLIEPKNLKRTAIAVVGGAAGLSVLRNIGETHMVRSAMRREMKKQLEPINKKLNELEEQNEQLKKQNEELQKKLAHR